jgi:hypothetical protein
VILVADCSALIALSVYNNLGLLEQLFNSIVVPKTVYNEATPPDKKKGQELKKPFCKTKGSPSWPVCLYWRGKNGSNVLYKQIA